MKQNTPPPDDSWESDAVWKLLDQAPPAQASSRFAADVLRAARLASPAPASAWWERLLSPTPLTGLATCAAAVALAFVAWNAGSPTPEISPKLASAPHAAEIQEIAETATLLAALDQLDDFSDHELVSLIGF